MNNNNNKKVRLLLLSFFKDAPLEGSKLNFKNSKQKKI